MNEKIFNYLFSLTHQSDWLDSLTVFVAQDLVWFWVVILIAIAVILFRRERTLEAVFFSASAAVISWSASQLVKISLGTERPFVSLPEGSTLLTYANSNAFTSSHAAFLFALAIAIYFYNRTLGVISLLIAVLVSAARVATGLHWPVDVIGGFFLAVLLTLLLRYFALKYRPPRAFV